MEKLLVALIISYIQCNIISNAIALPLQQHDESTSGTRDFRKLHTDSPVIRLFPKPILLPGHSKGPSRERPHIKDSPIFHIKSETITKAEEKKTKAPHNDHHYVAQDDIAHDEEDGMDEAPPDAEDAPADGEGGEGGEGSEDSGGGDNEGDGDGATTKKVTPSPEYLDTQFAKIGRLTAARMKVDKRIKFNYFPKKPVATACFRDTTIYNEVKVMKWLKMEPYNNYHSHRALLLDLREDIFKSGNSEECHSPNYTTWRTYLECAMRRNQRMESKIPRYPRHQVGYHGFYKSWDYVEHPRDLNELPDDVS